MYLNENFWKYTLGILIVFFLGLAGTSIGHIITYWHISNDWAYPEILAIENAIGIVSSILLSFHKSSRLRNLGISIFLATFFVELAGNVFYYYITIDPLSDNFVALSALTRPIFDPNGLTLNYNDSLRSWTAFIQGFWLPLTHVCVFASIAILIEREYKNKPDNTEAGGTNKNDDSKIQPDAQQAGESEPEENAPLPDDDLIDFLNDASSLASTEEGKKTEEARYGEKKDETGLKDENVPLKKKNLPVKKASFLSRVWKFKK